MATAKERHPAIYIERNEDTHSRPRTVPMRLLSLGYSRTGTMTMQLALETLGLPCWHWVTMSENPPDLAMWAECLEAKWEPELHGHTKPFGRAEFDNLLGHWSAMTDQPAAAMAEELVAAYPEAKVVLVERDVEKWFASFERTVIAGVENPFIPLAGAIDPWYIGQMGRQTDLLNTHFFHVTAPRFRWGLFNNPEHFRQWRENAREAYLAHNELVKRVVPKERLFVFKLEDGWEPLCRFLELPVPEVPFPRVNETEVVQEKINLYIAESYKRSAIRFAKKAVPVAVVLVAVSAWWVWR
ncbi:uncharacterized protein LTR77_010579 [Saxophila tyrrhenica]|uniref:P-loop containing nucleoside triphosphate hydrolase protein n=1 Tax=Saxophila tyrrhenica TaxID=1690608 RepID=A0AAV9NV62_9PEZI|nr:hypothetical protein LTR77_010579 [Saxophila tyrrhenica]